MRTALKWLMVALVIGFAAYRLKFAPVTVVAHKLTRGSVASEVVGTGTLEARVEATISPKIQGRLAEVLVDQNDPVIARQLLAKLDDAEWREQVAMAKAGLDAAVATVERVRADEGRAQAVLKQAQLNHGRALDLRKSNVSAESELDKAIESLRVAEADLKRGQSAITEAERQRVTVEKTLAYHEARLADTQLLSPFNGLVVRRDRDAGDVVVPGSSVLQIIATNDLWISAWVDESAMPHLTNGQKARVVFRSEPARSFPGEVARLGRQMDRETREFIVEVSVKVLPANWAVGQRAEVYVEAARNSSALVIPKDFISWREGKAGGFVEDGGKARWKEIAVGLSGDTGFEITHGMNEGEHVIKPDGGESLAEGQRIKTR